MATQAITIRLLTADDAGAFKALRLLAIDSDPGAIVFSRDEKEARTLQQIAQRITPDASQAVFGAFDGEQLIGIVGLKRGDLKKTLHKATIWGVFVDPAYRGKGIAGELMRAQIARARADQGLFQLYLGVNADNAAPRKLYESLGFVAFGIEPRALRLGDQFYDEQLMTLQLQ
ncbi:GNAT family N-acetyltransferase [Janthinobacterium agaricidamnosum]|uniref:Acetyltransferase family protein n=1 Tax=Janthinobacterium agaricidamnosum NBRC 102515 = DSM 9628 TaxID=1349767 RepID=W0V945_9BURK|nr:GNAT family N-acetyltransferase [Janthinobacterium agaricidamnosum]CDG83868.1 acetyltransferase family protein [Janthinobacterium agaricidamnosum NBRC 102515 = DSM 9628]